ncbi:UNVERIFIED_CONTAM: hypothetical protein FKN15_074723 [Acipenser sinensis]
MSRTDKRSAHSPAAAAIVQLCLCTDRCPLSSHRDFYKGHNTLGVQLVDGPCPDNPRTEFEHHGSGSRDITAANLAMRAKQRKTAWHCEEEEEMKSAPRSVACWAQAAQTQLSRR